MTYPRADETTNFRGVVSYRRVYQHQGDGDSTVELKYEDDRREILVLSFDQMRGLRKRVSESR